MPAEIGYSLQKGRRGSSTNMWGVQTHSGPPVFLVPFRKYLVRMNGTPQPNQKRPPALGIEPGSLDHESQPLTIGPLLTPILSSKVQLYVSNSYKILTSREKWRHMLRVDKACPQKQLHKQYRKHNVCVAGNHNNNSLLMHNYLSRYSASLASMMWCWWSATCTGGVNRRRSNTGCPLSVAQGVTASCKHKKSQ